MSGNNLLAVDLIAKTLAKEAIMENFHEKFKEFLEFNRREGRKGVAIYLAAATLTIVLAVAMGVSLLSTYQLKSLNEAGASVIAFAAAETGIEWSLVNITAAGYNSGNVTLANGATYSVTSTTCGDYLCVRSLGTYHGTQRAIKVQQ